LFDNEKIPLAKIVGTRCARILTYPTTDDSKARDRIRELSAVGVTSLQFTGSTLIDGIPVLGKGCVGIVTLAELDGVQVALKIRRDDADRPSMANEGRLLRLANSVNVGPALVTSTRNFLAMEFFRGMLLFRWAESQTASNTRAVKEVLESLLSACFKLDAIGLDHGELSHAPKNVLVNLRGEGCIVDFESASTVRRVANVTSLLQYFLFGRISRTIHASKIFPKKRPILKTLTQYKLEPSVENFQSILEVLGLRDESLL
jgi:putative serine/threonine protein kinase